MTPTTDNNDDQGGYLPPTAEDTSPPSVVEYQYDLRLEIGVKKEDETIPVVAIFHDLVKRMKIAADPQAVIVILTATDNLFFEHKEMSSEEFQKAFQVTETRGKMAKVLLGFKLRTTMKLSEIKKRIMHTFLIPNNMFLREHVGGFHHGVASYMYGFLKDEHPDHHDLQASSKRILRICKEAWKEVDKGDKIKWRDEFPTIYLGDNFPIIPIRFTKERISAVADGKERIVTHALMVSTPMKYNKILKTLLSIAVVKKKITNLIPFALGREDHTGYYNLVAAQARFMENHRNIPISNVPADAENYIGVHGKNLFQILTSNTKIQRVAYDPKTKQYHISTRANFYRETHKWISQILEQNKFAFHPEIKRMRFDYGTSDSKTSIYSDVFKDAISIAAETQETRTLQTPRTNAWHQRPPLAISYVKVNEAFPPLASKNPATQSTVSETLDEDTIQSAISAAIKKLEAQHQHEITTLKQELRTELDAMKTQMNDMAQMVATQTYQALSTADSPLATKAEFARLDHRQSIQETQLATIIELLKNRPLQDTGNSAQQPLTVTSPPRNSKRTKPTLTPVRKNLCTEVFSATTQSSDGYRPTKDFHMTMSTSDEDSVSSATSDLHEEMEGCED